MKFEEKLMKLRKERALSQEELGEKLNVTRQTVSKWELGQSKPEMDKLVEISKFFNVSLETLTNDEEDFEKSQDPIKKNNNTKGERKYILIILVIVAVLAVGLLISKVVGNVAGGVIGDAEGIIGNIFSFVTDSREEDMDNFKNTFIDMIDTMENKMEESEWQEEKETVKQEEQFKQEEYFESTTTNVNKEQENNKQFQQEQQTTQMEQIIKQQQEKTEQMQEEYKQQSEQMQQQYQEQVKQMQQQYQQQVEQMKPLF